MVIVLDIVPMALVELAVGFFSEHLTAVAVSFAVVDLCCKADQHLLD